MIRDTRNVTDAGPNIPGRGEWRRLNIELGDELHEGKQSRVFDARLDGRRVAVKLTDARLADVDVLNRRMEAIEALAAINATVVAPLRVGGALVERIGGWWTTATPFVVGERLDDNNADHALLLGSSLAELHRAMRRLPRFEIPPIAALKSADLELERTDWQLLHGDFSSSNILITPAGLRVLDLDDCGYGPVEYELANSLYMVLFDSHQAAHPEMYERFRPAFLAAYRDGSNTSISDAAVDQLIEIRLDALRAWLDNLDNAPIGIRTASPEWREVLATFVASRRPG